MIQQQSDFQIKFPLSVRRKFWKKLISSVLGYYIRWTIPLGILFVTLIFISVASKGKLPLSGVLFFIFVYHLLFLIVALFRGWYLKSYIKRYYYSAD